MRFLRINCKAQKKVALNYLPITLSDSPHASRIPAMAAGVTDRLWSVEDLVALWEAYEQRRAERAA